MVNNNYLESYKIQVVRRMLSREHLKVVSKELSIAKPTLWGWKCKYTPMLANEFALKEKPKQFEDFIDITNVSREVKEKPAYKNTNRN